MNEKMCKILYDECVSNSFSCVDERDVFINSIVCGLSPLICRKHSRSMRVLHLRASSEIIITIREKGPMRKWEGVRET